MSPTPAIVVHGGAGDLDPGMGTAARAGCQRAVEAGLEVLAASGSAVDAVVAAVRVLEEDPTFNAGVGAALARDGSIECDAAIMDGARRAIGAVAAMKDAGEAILVARAVLEDGEHVLLCGEGAWAFAREKGLGLAPRDLMTEKSRRRWEAARQKRSSVGTGGTVGACAIDAAGHVASATSTGGTTYKRVGRIGDTPLCGCGTYADEAGAASATGVGEAIIRATMTRVCVDAMRGGASASRAAWAAVEELGRVTGGTAGIIACDARGRLGAALSTSTMSFGAGRVGGKVVVGIDLARDADLESLLG